MIFFQNSFKDFSYSLNDDINLIVRIYNDYALIKLKKFYISKDKLIKLKKGTIGNITYNATNLDKSYPTEEEKYRCLMGISWEGTENINDELLLIITIYSFVYVFILNFDNQIIYLEKNYSVYDNVETPRVKEGYCRYNENRYKIIRFVLDFLEEYVSPLILIFNWNFILYIIISIFGHFVAMGFLLASLYGVKIKIINLFAYYFVITLFSISNYIIVAYNKNH